MYDWLCTLITVFASNGYSLVVATTKNEWYQNKDEFELKMYLIDRKMEQIWTKLLLNFDWILICNWNEMCMDNKNKIYQKNEWYVGVYQGLTQNWAKKWRNSNINLAKKEKMAKKM